MPSMAGDGHLLSHKDSQGPRADLSGRAPRNTWREAAALSQPHTNPASIRRDSRHALARFFAVVLGMDIVPMRGVRVTSMATAVPAANAMRVALMARCSHARSLTISRSKRCAICGSNQGDVGVLLVAEASADCGAMSSCGPFYYGHAIAIYDPPENRGA
jgi:hypothetical protein